MQKMLKRAKLNNKGSAIVTVIIIVSFITIIATTLLYISGMNYTIKLTDQRSKQGFYEAETGLEEIQAELVREVSEACAAAYQYTMENHATIVSGAELQSMFQDAYLANLQRIWDEKTADSIGPTAPATLTIAEYNQFVGSISDSVYNSGSNYLHFMPGYAGNVEIFTKTGTATKFAMVRGLEIQYTNDSGYTTILSTDFEITVPEIAWVVDSTGMTVKELDLSKYVHYINWVKK